MVRARFDRLLRARPSGWLRASARTRRQRRPLRVVIAVTALAVLVVSLVLFTRPGDDRVAPSLPTVGVQFHAFWSDYTDAEREEVLDRLQEAGVQWVRIDFSWAMLQPDGESTFSEYAVSLMDRILAMVQQRRMNVLLMFWRTPAWANDGAGETAAPSDAQEYANAARWLAERFEGRVAAWQIWNEPNDSQFFAGADAQAYASLLRPAYRAIKDVAPDALVIFGGLSFNDAEWLERAYAAGVRGHFDVMATHPYQVVANLPPDVPDDGTKWRLTHVTSVREVMVRNGDEDKDIWFTEFGWSSHDNAGPEVPHWAYGVSRQQQADYLAQTLHLVANRYEYVTHVFWYRERDSNGGNIQLDNYGLLDRDLRPKPAWDRLRRELRSPE
jgi:aryl-phospho-beta-D-glucosidase BglC (GH1 family)